MGRSSSRGPADAEHIFDQHQKQRGNIKRFELSYLALQSLEAAVPEGAPAPPEPMADPYGQAVKDEPGRNGTENRAPGRRVAVLVVTFREFANSRPGR